MRIVAGKWRGKTIQAPVGDTTRPTSDRAREMLFNILTSLLLKEGRQWHDISFADVFSGSGAIGIEALSRGARHVWCFENNSTAFTCLRQNAIGLNQIELMNRDALSPPIGKTVDILFMDAPYGKGLWQSALEAFEKAGWIDSETLVIIETDSRLKESLPESYILIQERSAGRNTFLFAKKKTNSMGE